MRKSITCAFIILTLFVTSMFAADLKIQYKDGGYGNTTDNHIKPHLNIINLGSDAVAMNTLTIRYYYSREGMAGEVFHVDYAAIGAGYVTGTFHTGYLEIGFTVLAGTIPGYGDSGEIQIRFNKEDWSNYIETGDFSYNSDAVSYMDWDRVTLYYDGLLIWGFEPGGSTNPPQTPAPTPDSPTPNPAPVQDGDALFVESGGIVVIEAEHYSVQAPGTGPACSSSWVETLHLAGSSNGSALKVVPNKGVNVLDTQDGPRLDYNVQFETTGTYHLWVRMWGPSVNDDSLHAGLDGVPASFGKSGLSITSFCWKWTNMVKARVTVAVETAGLHTVNIWMREDGTGLDKILLTLDPDYIPQGQGPAESPVETPPPPTPTPESGTPEPVTPGPSIIPGAGDVWFVPAEIVAPGGASIAVAIHINSGNQIISAYQFRLTFNADVLIVDTGRVLNGVEAGPDGFIAAVNAPTSGSLVFNGFDAAGTGPGVDLDFIRLYFITISPGTSPLALTIDNLVDNEANIIGIPRVTAGVVQVISDSPTPQATDLPTTEPTPTPTPDEITPSPTPSGTIMGDVNGDGNIDIIDALLCAQYYVGLSPSYFNTELSDVNADGEINIIDALYLAQYSVGLISEFPGASPAPGDPTPVPEEGAGSMWIYPPVQTIGINSEFTTEIHLNTGAQSLGAYGITILYDSNSINVGTGGIGEGLDGIGNLTVNQNTPGQLILGGIDPYGSKSGTDLHILTVHWISGNTAGTSALEIVINDLVDTEASVIGIPNGISGSVTVAGSEPSPIPGNSSQAGDVWFLPARQVVMAGEDVQAEIRVNSVDQKLAAYALDIIYDGNILSFVNLEAGADGFFSTYSTSNPGMVRVSGFDTSGKGPGPDLHLLTVHWHTSGAGTTALNLDVSTLVDETTNMIGTPNGIPGEIIIMPVTPGISLKAQYLCNVDSALTGMIRPYFNIINTGTEGVSLGDITLRYYYSKDGAVDEILSMDYADMGISFVTGTLYPDYLQVGFTEEAGVLESLEETGQIFCGIGRTDSDPYEQTYDYSFDPSYTDYADYRKVALFIGDTLVWGSVPLFPPVPNPTPAATPEPTPEVTSIPTYTPTATPGPTGEPGPGAGNVWFVPDNISVDEGALFETGIHVNSGNRKIAAYGFKIAFDQSVVQVNIDEGMEGVSAEPDGFVTVVNPDTPGELVFAGYDTAGKAAGADINFVKVYWVAVGPGTSTLGLTVDTMVDIDYNEIGILNGIGGQVTVIATSPTPDPTPTPEPTDYPGPIEGAGNVWFSPSSQTVNDGDLFTTEIHVNSGYQKVASFGFEIAFDPGVLSVNTALGNKGVEPGPDGFVLVVNTDTPGILRLSGADNGSGPGTDLHFHTIHWIATGQGTTPLDLTIEDLGDDNYNKIGTPNAIDGTVQVTGSGETPEPTPESPGAGSLWIEPADQVVNAGDGCGVEIHLNTGNQVLGAYQLKVGYDESVIVVMTGTGENGVEEGADGFVSSVNASIPGELVFNGFDTAGAGPGSDIHLATVYFTGIAAGTSQLTITVDTLVDLMYEIVGTPDGSGGTIQVVGTAVTPEPTPEPTIEPTSIPTAEPTETPTPAPTAVPSPMGDMGTVWFVPENQTVIMNENFTTEIHVNTGAQVLAAYGIDILYDQSIIAVNTAIGSNGVEKGPEGFLSAINPNTPGLLRTSGFDLAGAGPSTDFHLITVNWTAINTGTTALTINAGTIADPNGNEIGVPIGIGGIVTVQ